VWGCAGERGWEKRGGTGSWGGGATLGHKEPGPRRGGKGSAQKDPGPRLKASVTKLGLWRGGGGAWGQG